MSHYNKLSFFVLFMALVFTACQKENIDEIIPESPIVSVDTIEVNPLIQKISSDSSDFIYIDCIKIPYPVDFLQANDNIITINSEAELDAASTLTGPESIVNFVYPFDAEDNSGPITITGVEEFFFAIQDCVVIPVDTLDCLGTEPHVLLFFNALNIFTINKYQYKINYPVSLVVEGTQVVLNEDDDYLPAVGGSPFDLLETEMVYPITITQFGRDIVLNNDQEVCGFYKTLDEPCENKPAHIQFFFNEASGTAISCAYFINYPMEILFNGTVIQIQSRDDYLNELNSSPDAYDEIELVYPASVTKYSNSQQVDFNADADICQYLDNC